MKRTAYLDALEACTNIADLKECVAASVDHEAIDTVASLDDEIDDDEFAKFKAHMIERVSGKEFQFMAHPDSEAQAKARVAEAIVADPTIDNGVLVATLAESGFMVGVDLAAATETAPA